MGFFVSGELGVVVIARGLEGFVLNVGAGHRACNHTTETADNRTDRTAD